MESGRLTGIPQVASMAGGDGFDCWVNECYRDFATAWCYSAAMSVANRSVFRAFFRGLSWLLLAIGGLSFWGGGGAISEFGKVDRILAEFLGLSVAGVAGLFGYILKEKAEDVGDNSDSAAQ